MYSLAYIYWESRIPALATIFTATTITRHSKGSMSNARNRRRSSQNPLFCTFFLTPTRAHTHAHPVTSATGRTQLDTTRTRRSRGESRREKGTSKVAFETYGISSDPRWHCWRCPQIYLRPLSRTNQPLNSWWAVPPTRPLLRTRTPAWGLVWSFTAQHSTLLCAQQQSSFSMTPFACCAVQTF